MTNSAKTGAAPLICDCEASISFDPALNTPDQPVFTNLCGRQHAALLDRLAEGDAPIAIACGQESARFEEIAESAGADPARLSFVDLRDRAGWSDEGAAAGPKMAALLAEAALAAPPAATAPVSSEGVCLIYGPADVALPAAARLGDALSITCLLTDADDAIPPRRRDAALATGRIRTAAGRIGAFEVVVDAFAEAEAGGRGALRFAAPRDGAKADCDLILDLSGATALFPAPEKRDGYLRADPRDPVAVERALFDASQLVGEFDKTLFIRFEQSLCAHSRAKQTGCTRCLDVCPAGAIAPAGDHVAIDPYICAGCGACAAVCPTGAATYDDPPFEHLVLRMRTLADAYRGAGGRAPRLLIHDVEHGAEMIALAARYGRGLPAAVIPLEVVELGGVGHAAMLTALALGFEEVVLLAGPKTERDALDRQFRIAGALAAGVGVEAERLRMLLPTDPDALSDALYAPAPKPLGRAPALPLGGPRDAVRVSLTALAGDASPAAPIDLSGLEPGDAAPYGAVLVDQDACTLCLACVSLCPTAALSDNPDAPALRFQEDACVQCGICASACPETAITLAPRYDLSPAALSLSTLHEEPPFACIECGKEFGVKSTIERIVEKLVGQNWMYTNSDNARLIQMCDDCRVGAQFHAQSSPFQMGTPRKVRTTDDYLRERDEDADA